MFQNSLLQQFINVIQYSLNGLKFLFKNEFATRIVIYFFLCILPFLIFFELPRTTLLNTLILFLMLLGVKALNMAVEVIVDRVSPEISAMGKQAKDLGALSVMMFLIINIVHLIYAATLLDLSKFEWGKTLFISAACFLLGVYLSFDKQPQKKWKLAVTTIAGLYVVGTGIYIASNYFTGVGFDSKVIYHLRTGLKGAGFGEYTGLIVWMIIYAIAGALFTYFVQDLAGKKKHSLSKILTWFKYRNETFEQGDSLSQQHVQSFGLLKRSVAVAVLGASFLLNPFAQDVFEIVKNERISSAKITDYEFYAQPDSIKLTRKRNVVFIYLESFERTYFDTEIFPDLVPNLSKLEHENISFINMQYTRFTQWTIAGLLSTQCGVPLYSSSSGNAMSAYDAFMPNALCVGDILKKNGYDLTFMNGADTQFAGKDKFFKTHGFDTIKGRAEHRQNADNHGLFNDWGLSDDRLLDLAYDVYLEKSALETPFGLFLLTVDTHHPKGHVSNSCPDIKYMDGSNAMLNAVKCSDFVVSNFVEKIRNSEYAKDTLIVVLSDHLAMKNQAESLLKQGNRRNFFTIIDPYTRAPVQVDRPASSMDVGPTVLSYLGFSSQALGFGRNLMGPNQTLMEEKGDDANRFIISMKKVMQAELWKFPSLTGGIHFDISDGSLRIGSRSFNTPVMIMLKDDNSINDLIFFKSKSAEQDNYFRSNLKATDRMLWVDRCNVIFRHLTDNGAEPEGKNILDKFCAASKVDDDKPTIDVLESSSPIFTTLFPPLEVEAAP